MLKQIVLFVADTPTPVTLLPYICHAATLHQTERPLSTIACRGGGGSADSGGPRFVAAWFCTWLHKQTPLRIENNWDNW